MILNESKQSNQNTTKTLNESKQTNWNTTKTLIKFK